MEEIPLWTVIFMKKWEVSLLLGLALTLLWGSVNVAHQEDLSRRMIRLHVLANSDSEADQTLKLQVRDKVLCYAETTLAEQESVQSAAVALQQALPELQAIAAEEIADQGYDHAVTAELVRSEFPRRNYETFSLPKGEYLSLRVTIGDGAGQNWWCVVYPDLCHAACTEWEGLEESQIALITEDTPRYVFKFRVVELWQTIRQKLGK